MANHQSLAGVHPVFEGLADKFRKISNFSSQIFIYELFFKSKLYLVIEIPTSQSLDF